MSDAPCKTETLHVHGVHWVKDIDMTLLVNEQNGKIFILRGVEAIVWDWLTFHFTFAKMTGMLAIIFGCSAYEAETRLNAILHQWAENGFFTLEEGIIHD